MLNMKPLAVKKYFWARGLTFLCGWMCLSCSFWVDEPEEMVSQAKPEPEKKSEILIPIEAPKASQKMQREVASQATTEREEIRFECSILKMTPYKVHYACRGKWGKEAVRVLPADYELRTVKNELAPSEYIFKEGDPYPFQWLIKRDVFDRGVAVTN